MNKFLFLSISMYFCLAMNLNAQSPPQLTDAHREAMAKLDFLAGQWSGSGWMMQQGGVKHNFEQTENIRWKLDNTVLMIEGQGKSEGRIIHDALALISYNPHEEIYRFQSHLATGMSGDYTAELLDDQTFRWLLEMPGRTIRYTITINEKGQWFETGEFKMGDNWMQFFEMTLEKQG